MSSISLLSIRSPNPLFNFDPPKTRTQPPSLVTFFSSSNSNTRLSGALLLPVAAVSKKYKGTVMREEKLAEMIEKKVAEAIEACEGDDGKDSDGCKVAWDEVEEVSQAKADLRRKLAESDADPLESFCEENPETDECKVYED